METDEKQTVVLNIRVASNTAVQLSRRTKARRRGGALRFCRSDLIREMIEEYCDRHPFKEPQ